MDYPMGFLSPVELAAGEWLEERGGVCGKDAGA